MSTLDEFTEVVNVAISTKSAGRITSDPDICGGRPCIRGTRMRVRDLLDLLAAGADRKEILEDYPYIKDEDISAALEYAAVLTDHAVIAASVRAIRRSAGAAD